VHSQETNSGNSGNGTNFEEFQTGIFRQFVQNYPGRTCSGKKAGLAYSSFTPAIEIKSKNFILEIRTGSKGTGELFLDPSTQAVMKIVIQNNVMITQKNPENSQTNFSATCEKLTYIEKDDTVVMEGSPQVIQGSNLYSADRITYTFKENKLRFEGNVQVRFKKETAGSN